MFGTQRSSAYRERMPRRRPRPPVPDAPLGDAVDRIVAEWAEQDPELDVTPIEIVTRMARLRTRIDEQLAGVFARFDLTLADFTVIAALRRAGPPYTLPQSEVMARLALTSGTVSLRLTRLEAMGVVSRRPSTEDARGVLVTLTPAGRDLFDRVAPEHLANEDVLLSALTDAERTQLAGLLRKLLAGFEHDRTSSPLGFVVAPAHRARRARVAVGLSDRAGLLVEQVAAGSPAEQAGVRAGDVLVGLDGEPLHSCLDLAAATRAGHPLRLRVLRGEQERDAVLRVPRNGPDSG